MKKRRQEMIKITQENEKILKRLQQRTATYSVEKWNRDFDRHSVFQSISEKKPYVFGVHKTNLRLSSMNASTTNAGTNSMHRGSISGTAASIKRN
jgi:hypothetical protein